MKHEYSPLFIVRRKRNEFNRFLMFSSYREIRSILSDSHRYKDSVLHLTYMSSCVFSVSLDRRHGILSIDVEKKRYHNLDINSIDITYILISLVMGMRS